MCVMCVVQQTGITWQPTGVLGRKTYGRVGVNEENAPRNSLDLPTVFNMVKNTNVKRFGETYLILHGVPSSVIYGRLI